MKYLDSKKYGSTCLERLRLVGHKNFIRHNQPVYNGHMHITYIHRCILMAVIK